MRLRSTICAATLAITASMSSGAHSALIVDTGPGPQDATQGEIIPIDWNFAIAAKFSLTTQTTLNSIETWIAGRNGDPFLIGITGDTYGLPAGFGYEQYLYIDAFYPTVSNEASWQGVYGESWVLDPGDYWVVIQSYSGTAVLPTPSQSPLLSEAKNIAGVTGWYAETLQIGLRVEGTVVPLPASVWLLGSGLLGLLGVSRKNKH